MELINLSNIGPIDSPSDLKALAASNKLFLWHCLCGEILLAQNALSHLETATHHSQVVMLDKKLKQKKTAYMRCSCSAIIPRIKAENHWQSTTHAKILKKFEQNLMQYYELSNKTGSLISLPIFYMEFYRGQCDKLAQGNRKIQKLNYQKRTEFHHKDQSDEQNTQQTNANYYVSKKIKSKQRSTNMRKPSKTRKQIRNESPELQMRTPQQYDKSYNERESSRTQQMKRQLDQKDRQMRQQKQMAERQIRERLRVEQMLQQQNQAQKYQKQQMRQQMLMQDQQKRQAQQQNQDMKLQLQQMQQILYQKQQQLQQANNVIPVQFYDVHPQQQQEAFNSNYNQARYPENQYQQESNYNPTPQYSPNQHCQQEQDRETPNYHQQYEQERQFDDNRSAVHNSRSKRNPYELERKRSSSKPASSLRSSRISKSKSLAIKNDAISQKSKNLQSPSQKKSFKKESPQSSIKSFAKPTYRVQQQQNKPYGQSQNDTTIILTPETDKDQKTSINSSPDSEKFNESMTQGMKQEEIRAFNEQAAYI